MHVFGLEYQEKTHTKAMRTCKLHKEKNSSPDLGCSNPGTSSEETVLTTKLLC